MSHLILTKHAEQRASQRGLNIDQINLCVEYGDSFYKTGRVFYFVSKKCLRKLKKATGAYMDRLVGITIMGKYVRQGKFLIITVYKNKNSLSEIKRKRKRYERYEA